MTHEQLLVFATAAETLNFSETARRLFLAQPTISQQIKALERGLGLTLFERTGRGLRLTAAGETLLTFARRVRQELEAAESTLAAFHGELVGPLRVGASTTIGNYWLPEIAVAFRRAHPRVELSVAIGNSDAMLRSLQQGALHLVLTEGVQPVLPESRWEVRCCFEDRLVLVASPAAAPRVPLDAEALGARPWVVREVGSGTRDVLFAALAHAGVTLRDTLELGGTEAIKRAVRGGAGLACLSHMAIRDELASGELVELALPFEPIRRPWWLVQPHGQLLSPAGRAFVTALTRAATA